MHGMHDFLQTDVDCHPASTAGRAAAVPHGRGGTNTWEDDKGFNVRYRLSQQLIQLGYGTNSGLGDNFHFGNTLHQHPMRRTRRSPHSDLADDGIGR
jgi:hypothetical protein